MAENNTTGYELGWDDTIEKDSPDFILLPKGDYDFTVTSVERSRYSPKEGSKLPPCNMAVVTLEIESSEGTVHIKNNLYLHSSCEGLLCAFFTSIGQRKPGEPLKMNWPSVQGSRGRCKLGTRTYKNSEGEDVTVNDIKKFYEPDPNTTSSRSAGQPAYQAGKF